MTTHRAIVDGLVKASSSGESVVLATVVRVTGSSYGGVGARMLVRGDGSTVGLVREFGGLEVAYEVLTPAIPLVICGSGPDVVPLAGFATELGWTVTVVDHRPIDDSHASRYPGARVIESPEAAKLGEILKLNERTAAVVMSHNLARDTDYVSALLAANVAYSGVLGPRGRTEKMLHDIASRSSELLKNSPRLFAPVGIDIGGDGPDAIALAIVAEISAVVNQ